MIENEAKMVRSEVRALEIGLRLVVGSGLAWWLARIPKPIMVSSRRPRVTLVLVDREFCVLSARNLGDPSLLLDFEEINLNTNNVQGLPPVVEELLQAPTDGVGDAIVVPPVLSSQFELKIRLLNLVATISFHVFENNDPHSHIRRDQKCKFPISLSLPRLKQSHCLFNPYFPLTHKPYLLVNLITPITRMASLSCKEKAARIGGKSNAFKTQFND
nr:reverse transcriptase domain-containing protein [Tanacetum cinerariifolium]